MVTCRVCNETLPSRAKFCSNCGAAAPESVNAADLPVRDTPPYPAMMVDAPDPFLPMDDPPQPITAPLPKLTGWGAASLTPAPSPWPAPASAYAASSGYYAAPAPASVAMVAINQPGTSFLVRVLWYLFIGWWLAGLATLLGYVLALTIIGLPLALMIFNRLGTVLTLRPYATEP